ncbi:PqqD family protein [Desulfonema ishimotonii]|uniref:PqqD family protein n=2 Tax=Desulfonema ishimotonii TaxID=45657 RepID=A0A401G400_9BACT|nr:PqqD family protein [Desulfonema ishimotonii]
MTRAEALGCRPVRSGEITEEVLASGLVRITYPVRMRPLLASLARRFGGSDRPVMRKLELDTLGTAVWHLIDGQRPVEQIVRAFAKMYTLQPKEADLSVTAFIRELGRRGIIGLK